MATQRQPLEGGQLDRSGLSGAADATRYRGRNNIDMAKRPKGHLAAVVDGAERGLRSENALRAVAVHGVAKASIQTVCFRINSPLADGCRSHLRTFERPALRKSGPRRRSTCRRRSITASHCVNTELCWLATAATASSRTTTATSSTSSAE